MMSDSLRWTRSDDLLRVVVDRSPFVFFRFRARPDPRFEFVSRSARHVYGYTPEEFYRNPEILARRIHGEDRPRLEEILADPARAGAEGRVLRWYRRDGRLVTTTSWTFPVTNGDDSVVLEGLNQEITGWHDPTRAPPDGTRLLNALGDAVVCCDPDGTIRFFDRAAEELLGWPAPEVVGRDAVSLLQPGRTGVEVRALVARAEAGETATRDLPARRKDGTRVRLRMSASPLRDGAGDVTGVLSTLRRVEESATGDETSPGRSRPAGLPSAGRPVEIVGSRSDVTERKEADLELDRFFSFSLDLLCIADFEGRFVRVNPAFTEILGWSEEELLDRPFLDFVHPDDRERTEATTRRAAEGEITTFENRYRTKDGGYRWIHWKSTAVAEEEKIYAAARDVTRRKEAEEELRRLTRELEARVRKRTAALEGANETLREELTRRERAERAHDRAESRYRDVFHYAPMGIVQVGGDGFVLNGNGTLARMLGHASSDE